MANALVRRTGGEAARRFLAPLAEAMLPDRADKAAGEVARLVGKAEEHLAADQPVTGWPRLAEAIGAKRAAAIEKWLGLPKATGEDEAALPGRLSEDALALELGEGWNARARHVALWGKWLFWDGSRWAADERLLHLTETREFLRAKAAAFPAAAGALRKSKTVAAVAGLARSNGELAAIGGAVGPRPVAAGHARRHGRAAHRAAAAGAAGRPHHQARRRGARPSGHARAALDGLPGADLRRRPGDDPLRAAGRRLRPRRQRRGARPVLPAGGRARTARACSSTPSPGSSATTPAWRRWTCSWSARPTATRPTWRCCARPGS